MGNNTAFDLLLCHSIGFQTILDLKLQSIDYFIQFECKMRSNTTFALISLVLNSLFMKNLYCEDQTVHHRVRRFVFTKNSKVSFDVDLSIPVPSLGGVDVQLDLSFPLSITMLNDTLIFNPITIPYVVVPAADPQAVPLNFPSFMPNYYSYDSYYGSPGGSPYFPHQAMKRSIGAASAQHRYDLFNSIGEILERFVLFSHKQCFESFSVEGMESKGGPVFVERFVSWPTLQCLLNHHFMKFWNIF